MKNSSSHKRLKFSVLTFISFMVLLITTNTVLYSKPQYHKDQHSFIIETAKFSDILSHIDPQTLVVVDIDNTLIHSKTMLGSAQWFYHLVQEGEKRGLSRKDSLEENFSTWKKVQRFVEVEPVEANIPSLIKQIQEKSRVIGLTSRPSGVEHLTQQQLNQAGIYFAKNNQEQFELNISDDQTVLIDEGVIFTGDHQLDKGLVLKRLLEEYFADQLIHKIVFIDDQLINVKRVQTAMVGTHLEFVGFHYLGSQRQLQEFDPVVVDKQMALLNHVMSDKAAASLLKYEGIEEYLNQYEDFIEGNNRIDITLTNPSKLPPPYLVPRPEDAPPSTFIESTNISDILSLCDQRTLVVFDLNDTLITTKHCLGSDLWAGNILKEKKAKGLSQEEILDKLVPTWRAIIDKSIMIPVETTTPLVFKKLKERGCAMIGLTARYIEIAPTTIDQLQSVSIDFSDHQALANDMTLHTTYPSKLLHGVIFAGLQNKKGAALIQFLEQNPLDFDQIVYVDDKRSHVEEVLRAAQSMGKPSIGIWYRRIESDPFKQTAVTQPNIAKLQMVFLNRIVPDKLVKWLFANPDRF